MEIEEKFIFFSWYTLKYYVSESADPVKERKGKKERERERANLQGDW